MDWDNLNADVTKLMGVHFSAGREGRTIDTLADRVALLERRDDAWQRGWDQLRDGWPEVRQRPDPPPYPTPRLN